MVRDSVYATWSNVLWSSLRTITRHAPPSPLSGPATRGRSMVCGIPLVVAAALPVAPQPGVLLLDRHRLLDRLHFPRGREALAVRGEPRVLIELARPGGEVVEVGAHAVELRADVLEAPEVRRGDGARVPSLDELERRAPGLQVDVGRRGRREHRAVAD